ncbi:hypothetical protein DUI87_10741 [Hirundo rustica rustica]|uniref:Uncharacterized protein n=1 Tax=Hirundo rustica rustica TaxID=333673 RepID=A0A3M0L1E3_HIRRU|nr:hypothetical protein DUI87_10741 [Hirundo rustica rustica]
MVQSLELQKFALATSVTKRSGELLERLKMGTTMLTQLFIMIIVNVTIGLVGKLEVKRNKTELEMDLELPKNFHMICKLRT